MDRNELLKKAGKMVTIYYHSQAGYKCFAIGWFYALDTEEVKLKVTSTRNETYESIQIQLELVDSIEDYDIN